MCTQFFRYFQENNQIPYLGIKRNDKIYKIGPCDEIESFLKHIAREYSASELAKLEEIQMPDVSLLTTPFPSSIEMQKIAAGMNYQDHLKETKLQIARPVMFPKLSNISKWNEPVFYYGEKEGLLDYEVEWAFMLKKGITKENLSLLCEENAADYIAGVFLILDMTAREDQVRFSKPGNTYFGFAKAKGKKSYSPVGQFFISYTDFLKIKDSFRMTLKVNGMLKQDSNLSKMSLSPVELIKEIFSDESMKRKFASVSGKDEVNLFNGVLSVGDIVLTGTPAGMAFKAPSKMTKFKGIIYGLLRGNAVEGAKDYIVEHQAKHLLPGDSVLATGTLLGNIELSVKAFTQ